MIWCTCCNQSFNRGTGPQGSYWISLFLPLRRSNWNEHADNLAPLGSQDDTTPYLLFIRHLDVRFIINTDGSAAAGTFSGGAGMVVTEGDPANSTTILTKQQSGAATGLLAMRRRMPVLTMRQHLPSVLPDQSPSPQPVHSAVELLRTRRLATTE